MFLPSDFGVFAGLGWWGGLGWWAELVGWLAEGGWGLGWAGLGWAGQGAGWAAPGFWFGIGWDLYSLTFNENSKLMNMQFEENFTQFLFILLLRV